MPGRKKSSPPVYSVMDVRNTQVSVQDRIDGGKGRQTALIPWVCDLLRGRIQLEKLPHIRVGRQDGHLYSIDNRRCLTYKALWINNPEVMRLHRWTKEFDDKLGGSGGGPWPTRGDGALQQFRWAVLRELNRSCLPGSNAERNADDWSSGLRLAFDPGMQERSACIYIPTVLFGQEDNVDLESMLTQLGISDIIRPEKLRRHSRIHPSFAGYLGYSSCAEAHIYVNKDKQKQPAFDYLGNFAVGISLESADPGELFTELVNSIRATANAALPSLS